MKIAVLGAGALGCAIGGTLAEAGNDVVLINRSQAHVDAIWAGGLRMRGPDGERRVAVRAEVDCSALGPVELLIVLVKSFHTQQAIAGAASLVGPDTVVLSLQNGLGHEDILAEAVGRERVIAGKTYVGGVMLAPGHIISGTVGKETLIGELDGSASPRVQRIADTFEAAGLRTTVSTRIMGTIWDKLLINVATGAVSGITGLPYGPLYAIPEIEATAVAAVQEAMDVARASGVQISYTDPKAPWTKAAAGLPDDFKTSMLQSLEKGSITEIDFINGAVVRWGQRCGVATPVNATLVTCIKGVEQARQARRAPNDQETKT
ncbi:2-dehydropantoate 2-reductase [Pseudacidovorax sp. 1753]|uniref:ketopantoate reductase family protein n=1 Tax=Pseudacidovorax sp. 1753 TaxID=3156419 RepID=UPI0033960D6F